MALTKARFRMIDKAFVTPRDYGADTSASDNSAALAAMYADNPNSVYFEDFYPVTGNFARGSMPHYGPGGVTIGGADIPLGTTVTAAETTVHVDPAGSDTANHGLSATYPFKTIQRAIDSLPKVILHQQDISLVAGTYNESVRTAASQRRPAIVKIDDKYIARRTSQSSGNLVGKLRIVGVGDTSIIETDTASGYTYGLYATGGGVEVAVEDVKIQPGSGSGTQALLVAHRSAKVHDLRVTVDSSAGGGTLNGRLAESAGQMESIDPGDSQGATSFDVLAFDESIISLDTVTAVGTSTIGKINVTGGKISIGGDVAIATLASVTTGGKLSAAKSGSYVPSINDLTVERGCAATLSEAELTGTATFRSAGKLSSCNWSGQIIADGCAVEISGGTSYISPATQSTVAEPLSRINGGDFWLRFNPAIVNSSGAQPGPATNIQLVTPAANNGTITIQYKPGHMIIEVAASGSNRTGWTFAAEPSGVNSGQKFGNGDRVTVYGNAFKTQIVDGGGWRFPGGAIEISENQPGSYTGFEGVYDADSDEWRIVGLGTQF